MYLLNFYYELFVGKVELFIITFFSLFHSVNSKYYYILSKVAKISHCEIVIE